MSEPPPFGFPRTTNCPRIRHDLRTIGVEIDLTVERGEARGVSQVRRHMHANYGNGARERMHNDDGVAA